MKNPICLFIALLLSCFKILSENVTDLKFRPLPTTTALPSSEVRNIYQDKQGYIWISTYNGLVRYDGYSTLLFRPNSNSPEKSINAYVNIVAEDNESKLWIGTHGGLYVFDKKTEIMERVTYPDLRISYIEALLCSRNGDVWVGCNKGLFVKKNGNKTFEHVTDNIFNEQNNDVKSIIEGKNNNIWIGTWNNGLFRYDTVNKIFFHYKGINSSESAHILFEDKVNNLWVGTWRHGLIKITNPYDIKNYSLTHFVHDSNNHNSLSDDIVYSIAQDSNTGNIWVGTRRGLSILDINKTCKTDAFTNYLPSNEDNYKLPFNEVDALLSTKDGTMWIGMLGGGVCMANTNNMQFLFDPLNNLKKDFQTSSVRTVFRYNENRFWLGIMGFGLVMYDTNTKQYKHYKDIPGFSNLNIVSSVNDIIYYSYKKEFVFATWDDGLWFFDGKNVKTINHSNCPILNDVCIFSICEDKEGNLWIGTRSGLFIMDINGDIFSINDIIPEEKRAIPQSSIFSIKCDDNGNIWVATPTDGVWRIHKKNDRYHCSMYNVKNNNMQSIGAISLLVDSNDRVWAGTNGNGLDIYDRTNDCFVSVYNDIFDEGDVVLSIIEDNTGNLWFPTYTKMFKLSITDKGTNVFSHSIEYGLQNNMFNRNSCFKDKNGDLFFGGVNGLTYFSPDKIKHEKSNSNIVITDFKIYGKSVRNIDIKTRNDIMKSSIDYTDRFTINHKQNNFSIDFSLLNYTDHNANRYKYKLVGYDKNWNNISSGRYSAYYSNLPAGEYEFMVKGENINGVWYDNIKSVYIKILPAPWLSWWAFVIYSIVFILLVYFFVRFINNRIEIRQALKLSIIENHKLEEVNHAKLQFFTNITHELLTPLFIISASIDELKLHYPELKKTTVPMSDNIQRLTRLIQQILEFRKIENGKQKLRVSEGNITKFIASSVAAFSPLVRKRKLNIIFEKSEKDIIGYFDIDKMDKIIYNLLSNSSKYTSEYGTITIKESYDTSSGIFTISVNNPSEELSKEKLEHIFERFYEGEYRKFHTIGTGIGLSLTKDLVLLHHGSINVESSKESGVTFIVRIPLNHDAYNSEEIENITTYDNGSIYTEVEDETESIISDKYESYTKGDTKYTILIVDDNDELRQVMLSLISDYYNVLQAADGNEAISILTNENVDLVLSDIMMPEMDGYELCSRIKEKFETKHIPVILLSAKTSDSDRVKGYGVGADGYLCKPINTNVLIAKINNLLKKNETDIKDSRKKLVFEAKDINYTSQDEEFLKLAMDIVNTNLQDPNFDSSAFSSHMGMSRTALNEKLKQLTGMTPASFLSNVRLQAAFKLIQESRKIRITELAYSVGFNDPKYFSLCFRKKFGISPKELMNEKDD